MNPRLAQRTIRLGLPNKDQLSVRVDPPVKERLRDLAASRSQTPSGYVRALLADHIAELDGPPRPFRTGSER